MAGMLRFYCLLIWVCLPGLGASKPSANSDMPAPSSASQAQLQSILEQLIRDDALPPPDTLTNRTRSPSRWHEHVHIWLTTQQQKHQFDTKNHAVLNAPLGWLSMSTYRTSKTQTTSVVPPFSSAQHPVMQQLPTVSLEDDVILKLRVPLSTSGRYLALTTQTPHSVQLNGTPLDVLHSSPWYYLDNHLYKIPAITLNDEVTLTMRVNHGHRSIAARLFPKYPKQRDEFYGCIDTVHTHAQASWFSALWATVHLDEKQMRSTRPWVLEQLETSAPWRYAYLLFKQDALEQWLPKFDALPDETSERIWWRALTYESGQAAIRTGRLKTAYQRIENLKRAQDALSQKRSVELMAALLDDAGLSAKAAQLLAPFPNELSTLRQRYAYLVNAGLLTQSERLLHQIAIAPNRSRSDVYAWLSGLYRAGHTSTFHKARHTALRTCPSCWQLFGVTGEDVLPAMNKDALKSLAGVPGLEAFSQLTVLTQKAPVSQSPKTAERDAFFDKRSPISKVQLEAPIRNLRMHQQVQLNKDGLSSVRVQRLVEISANMGGEPVSFTLDYVPTRQFIQIHRALLRRSGMSDINPVETDESTDQPNARLYYDSRRRRLTFANLKPGDYIELDWSVVDHSSDSELPGLDGWVFPLNEQWPTDESTISWHSDQRPIIAQLSEQKKPLSTTSIQRKHLANNRNEKGVEGFLMLSLIHDWQTLDTLYETGIKARYSPTKYLAKIARSIIGQASNPEEQLERLFSAVQQDVHYVGLELGDHSRTPEWAENVWRRGLGDCKDKAALLIALAKTVDIELSFALIRTRLLPQLTHGLPTLALFDHAAVYAPKWKRFLDPNQPNLGLNVLPALIQGAQAHVVGISNGLMKVPIGDLQDESVQWTFDRKDAKTNTWHTTLQIKGHASTGIRGRAALDESHNRHVSQLIAQLLPGWNIDDIQIGKFDLNQSMITVKLKVRPIKTDVEVLLRTLIQSPTAWYNQTKKALFRAHDLPRSFMLNIPMAKHWSNRDHQRIEVPGGRILLKPHQVDQQWRLTLTAELTDPTAYVDEAKSSMLSLILEHLRGSK